MIKLIALTGLIGSGKSTVAAHLVTQHGFELVKFAGGIKTMLRALLNYIHVGQPLIESMIEGENKEIPTFIFEGCTTRQAMQTLGTEWGRKQIGEDFWVHIAAARIESLLNRGVSVVVDDCRYPNEAAAIMALGGEVWKIQRQGIAQGDHSSEQDQRLIRPNRLVVNNSSIKDLLAAVDYAVNA